MFICACVSYMHRRLTVLAVRCVYAVFECILMRVGANYRMYVVTSILVGACVHDITCVSTLMCIFLHLN